MVRPRTLLVIPFSRIDSCGGWWTIAVLKRIVRCQIAFRSDAGRMGACFLWADSMAWGRRRCLSIMDSARSSSVTILVGNRWRMISIVVTPPARVLNRSEEPVSDCSPCRLCHRSCDTFGRRDVGPVPGNLVSTFSRPARACGGSAGDKVAGHLSAPIRCVCPV